MAGPGCTAISFRPRAAWDTLLDRQPRAEAPGTDAFRGAMDRLTGTSAHGGNRVVLLVNGEQAFPLMLSAIRDARKRISMESYIFRSDGTGRRFRDALAAAAARGVEVRLLLDAYGARKLSETCRRKLQDAGVRLRWFNPLGRWTVVRINNRNHRKTLTVDGRIAFMGGLNIGDEYAGDGRTGFRDTHLRIEGPAAGAVERVFAASWRQGGAGLLGRDLPVVGTSGLKRAIDAPLKAVLREPESFAPPSADAVAASDGVPVRIVASRPADTDSAVLRMYLLAINSARSRVWIANGYFIPPRRLERALVRARRRGVDVRLLLQGKTDEPTTRVISLGFYGRLLEAGVTIHEWPHSVLHSKCMVVDGRWTTIGSANLDGRALFLNYEANAAVLDRALGNALERRFEADFRASRPVTYAEWKARPLGQKAREVLLTPVEGQF